MCMEKLFSIYCVAILSITTSTTVFSYNKGHHPYSGTGSHHKSDCCSPERWLIMKIIKYEALGTVFLSGTTLAFSPVINGSTRELNIRRWNEVFCGRQEMVWLISSARLLFSPARSFISHLHYNVHQKQALRWSVFFLPALHITMAMGGLRHLSATSFDLRIKPISFNGKIIYFISIS